MPSLVEIGPVVLEKIFKKFVNNFRYFVIICPWKKGGTLHFPFTQGCIVPSLVEIGPEVLEKKIFFNFRYFVIISPWKMSPSFEQS